MNIYKHLLVLQGTLPEPEATEDDFGPTYGNRVAARRAFRERWELKSDPAEFGSLFTRMEACGGGCG